MYKLATLTPLELVQLGKMPIPNQAKIIEKTGEPLMPLEVFNYLKDLTEGFQKQNDLALEVDTLLYELAERQGVLKGTSKTQAQPTPAPKPAPKPVNPKDELTGAIESLEVSLEFVEGADKDAIENAISALRIALEFS